MQQHRLPAAIRRALYALGAVLALILEQCVFARLPVCGAVPGLLPVVVALTAAFEGPEAGGLFGLGTGLFRYLALAPYGPLYIFTLTLGGVLTGLAFRSLFVRGLWSSLLAAAFMLVLCQGSVLLLIWISGTLQLRAFLLQAAYSLLFVFPFYPVTRLISRLGGK